ncbi:hypothetical protein [Asaia platycodi]|uniref:hypothetical protein n=1 Tax=Asaia platycodi TaxID=610243 RepID=UPI0004711DBF|nr:hypothetical protein [Asaia platycodi]
MRDRDRHERGVIPHPDKGNLGDALTYVHCSASLNAARATSSEAGASDITLSNEPGVVKFEISLSLLESELKRLGLDIQSRIHVMVEIVSSDEGCATKLRKRSRLAWLAEEQETYIDPYVTTR